jgi:hypothetical protein
MGKNKDEEWLPPKRPKSPIPNSFSNKALREAKKKKSKIKQKLSYHCPSCTKKFVDRSQLRDHKRLHGMISSISLDCMFW